MTYFQIANSNDISPHLKIGMVRPIQTKSYFYKPCVCVPTNEMPSFVICKEMVEGEQMSGQMVTHMLKCRSHVLMS